MSFDCDVLVVGGGPVGEVLLTLLGSRGISAIGLEKDSQVWPKPRAVHFDGETLRTFQSIGLGDSVAARCTPMLNYRMENEAGEVLLEIPTGALGSHGWHDDYMFNQPEIDRLLRSELLHYPSVQLLAGNTVESIAQDEESVSCVVRDAEGSTRTYTARYVVGCDGASSQVRRAIGATFEVLGPNDPWLVVDGLCGDVPPIDGSMVFFGHHSRPKIWAKMPGGRGRMEFKVLESDDRDELVKPEKLVDLSGGLLTPDNFQIERTAVYMFRSCLADRWRERRVFIAGDAAHLSPPLYGQGLCSGIRDVVNLAWKLQIVLEGGDPGLLDTYESDRSPHARAWITQATTMSGIVQTTDPAVAADRDAHVRKNPAETAPKVPLLGSGLHGSEPEPAGTCAIQPALGDGARFDDRIGNRFLIVARPRLWAILSPEQQNALTGPRDMVYLLREDEPGFEDLLKSVDAEALVVRPDRYILGAASTPERFHELCAQVTKILQPVSVH